MPKKNNTIVIVLITIIILLMIIVGVIFFLYNKEKNENISKNIEIEDFDKNDTADDKEEVEEKEAIILSEQSLTIGSYGIKTFQDKTDDDSDKTIYINEGVHEIELMSSGSVYIHIADMMGTEKLKILLTNNNEANDMKKVTEAYLFSQMFFRVESISNLNSNVSTQVVLRELGKELDLKTSKQGKEFIAETLEYPAHYTVGQELEEGLYDIELIAGEAGVVIIEDSNGNSKADFTFYSNDSLFKNMQLNNGDKIAFSIAGPPDANAIKPKYKFVK